MGSITGKPFWLWHWVLYCFILVHVETRHVHGLEIFLLDAQYIFKTALFSATVSTFGCADAVQLSLLVRVFSTQMNIFRHRVAWQILMMLWFRLLWNTQWWPLHVSARCLWALNIVAASYRRALAETLNLCDMYMMWYSHNVVPACIYTRFCSIAQLCRPSGAHHEFNSHTICTWYCIYGTIHFTYCDEFLLPTTRTLTISHYSHSMIISTALNCRSLWLVNK